ncbi:T9SS type A sorting domain-containing protein [Adhaeribacter terreus]|uniref:T9SS type A sorting domain-containing protein n=1 Tax=Adhaeribacter terreus TaxID=529703 RepID=A0ABW0E9M1_9BACT
MRNFIPNFSQFRSLAIVFSLICSAAVSAWAQISISSVSPNSGPVGRTVTINGAGMAGVNDVRFNGAVAAITSVSAGQVVVTVPAAATSGKISVSNGTNTVQSSSDFTVYVTWVGGFNGNSWDDTRNWSNGKVPDATTNVMIEGGGSPVVSNAAECKKLELINSTLTLNQATSQLMVYGDFTNAGGTYAHTAGTINFVGGNQLIPALDYHNVVIAGTGTKQLLGSASVNDLTFSGTNSNLVASNPTTTTLTLNGAISGETATRNFIGRLEKTRLVDQNTSSDVFGNIGVHFNNAGNGNWGNVIVTRVTGSAITNPDNPTYHSINRYWDIVPQNPNTNTLVSLTLTWLTSENNNLDFLSNKAQAWRSEDSGTSWTPVDVPQTISATTVNGERSITVATKTFSKWGISDENNPLPVSWLSFTAKATANGNVLSWATASEKNSDKFVVERSVNGKAFEAIGAVKAAGNSSQILTYNFTDAMPAGAEKTYYRLKQTDFDGAFTYSTIVVVEKTVKGRSVDASVYPNPFAGTLNLKLQAADGVSEVKLISLDGKEVYRKAIVSEANVTLSDLPVLKPGMYLLQLHGANGITTLKVARQ